MPTPTTSTRFNFDPGWGDDTIFGFQDNVDKIEIWVPFVAFNDLHITQGAGTAAIVSLYVDARAIRSATRSRSMASMPTS